MTFINKVLATILTKMIKNSNKVYKQPFTMCVEGNIGSGKTTFLNHFKKYDNITILEEPVNLWQNVAGTNLLELMYSDLPRYTFLFQSYVLLTMLQRHTYETPLPYKIMERSLYSSRCFVENIKRSKLIHDVEVTVLENWTEWCINNANIKMDLIVYIRTSPEIAYQRVQKRERQEETSLTIEYLKKIHNIHEEWLYHQTLFKVPTPILIFDGNKNLEEMLSEVENCRNQIFSNQIFNKELEKKEAGDIIYAQSL